MNRKDILRIVLLVIAFVFCSVLADRIGNSQQDEEIRIVRDAVREAAVTCYAVEGAYPENIEYLKENYHLAYNEKRFIVKLSSFASNRIPDIYVLERGEASR